jgi:DNA-damage-inducible protein D
MILEYTQWRNFNQVIEKAKIACENSGISVSDHFADVSKTIDMPKGAKKKLTM